MKKKGQKNQEKNKKSKKIKYNQKLLEKENIIEKD